MQAKYNVGQKMTFWELKDPSWNTKFKNIVMIY